MRRVTSFIAAAGTLALGACAVAPPSRPTVMALPPQGKSFGQFQGEDANCRGFAYQAGGGQQAANAATQNGVGTAVLGTALGAGVGAAIGSVGGAVGAGAAIGAASGALLGTAAGANNAQFSAAGNQQAYDIAYTQCMAASGNIVQSAPGGAVAAYGSPGFAYGYGPGVVVGPTVAVGFGGGWSGYRGGYYGYRGWTGGPYGHGWYR